MRRLQVATPRPFYSSGNGYTQETHCPCNTRAQGQIPSELDQTDDGTTASRPQTHSRITYGDTRYQFGISPLVICKSHVFCSEAKTNSQIEILLFGPLASLGLQIKRQSHGGGVAFVLGIRSSASKVQSQPESLGFADGF